MESWTVFANKTVTSNAVELLNETLKAQCCKRCAAPV